LKNPQLEFKTISKHRMVNHYYPKLKTSLETIGNDIIWHKDSEGLNSIGGIVLHIIEHVKRNTARLIDPDVKFHEGIENFFPNLNMDKHIILEELKRAFSDFEVALDHLNAEQIDMYNIYHLVEHTGYHVGQIIDRIQRTTGIRFRFVQNGLNEKELKKIVDEELKHQPEKFG